MDRFVLQQLLIACQRRCLRFGLQWIRFGISHSGDRILTPGLQWKTEKVCNGPIVAPSPDVNGSGVINTNPLAMVASANIGGGLDVVVRVDVHRRLRRGDRRHRSGTACPQGSSGSTAARFRRDHGGHAGDREGAVAMMGMSSPTGYLDLIQPAISAATQTGTGSVDGVAVTNYTVSNDLNQLAGAAGTSSTEAQTITSALTLLKSQGYTSNSAVVSIDGAGFIRQVKSTDTFSDGGTVTLLASFSNFGCAGTILMPGQTGAGVPPTGCTSPDGPNSSTTTTSTSLAAPPTTISSSATPVPGSATTTPRSGASTTSTVASGKPTVQARRVGVHPVHDLELLAVLLGYPVEVHANVADSAAAMSPPSRLAASATAAHRRSVPSASSSTSSGSASSP